MNNLAEVHELAYKFVNDKYLAVTKQTVVVPVKKEKDTEKESTSKK